MQLFEKIKFIRQLKSWSQEEMAFRLNMSNSGYGSIERGETDVNLSRLEEIAKIFGMELAELFSLKEGNIFHVGDNHVGDNSTLHSLSNINSSQPTLSDFQHTIEKLQFLNEQQAKEVEYLKRENANLREIISLLKKGE